MLPLAPVLLERKRVRLEPLALTHLADLAQQTNDPEIWQFMGSGNLQDRERLERFVTAALEETAKGEGMTFAQVDVATGKAVGTTTIFDIDHRHRRVEIGRTWLGKAYWRSGINTEAKYLLLTHCFETMKVNRVTIKTDARNIRSQTAIERLGAVREGVLRYHMVLWDGYIRDTVYFGIIAPEWPATKARLETRMEQYS